MYRILVTLSMVLAPSAAFAQEKIGPAVPAPPAAAPPSELVPLDQGREPVTRDNTLDRIEQRLDRIEGRLQRDADLGSGSDAVVPEKQAVPEPADIADNSWRFKNHNGTWWYWMPSNRWVYWSNGSWVDYSPDTYVAPQTVTAYRVPDYHYAPAYTYTPSFSYGSYPYYGSSNGYYGSGYPYYGRSYSYYGGGYPNYGGHYGNWIGTGLAIGLSFIDSGHHHHGHRHHHHGHHHRGGHHRHGGHHHH
jgi:hypothetical protein